MAMDYSKTRSPSTDDELLTESDTEETKTTLPLKRSKIQSDEGVSSTTLTSNDLLPCKAEPSVTSTKPKKLKLLLPCKVCGEKASGLHYGVNTCEACKGFFRRSMSRGENFLCAENNDCKIMPGRRNNCAACRYKKCISLGMSKEAIKIGRYTHEKRTQDILELKNQTNSSNSKLLVTEDNTTSSDDYKANSSDAAVSNSEAHCQLVAHRQKKLPSIYEQKVIYSMSVVDEVQKYMKRLSEAMVHMKYFFAAKPAVQLPNLVQKRLAESRLETELLGEEVIPNNEYVKVMAETGLDLDSRKELIQHWAEGIEETFIVIAQFAKCTPGFQTLPMEDQISLIKETRSQILFAASHKRFDFSNKCFIGRFNRVESFQDIVKIYNNKQFVDTMMTLARRFSRIRLTDVEWLLVLASIMTYPEERKLKSLSDKAQQTLRVMHSQEQKILEFYLKLNHPECPEYGQEIHELCTFLRRSNKYHNKIVEEIRTVWRDYLNFPPLFEEMMSTDIHHSKVIHRQKPKGCDMMIKSERGEPIPMFADMNLRSKVHWKKSTIAQILQSSDHINKLMSQANLRSRDQAEDSRHSVRHLSLVKSQTNPFELLSTAPTSPTPHSSTLQSQGGGNPYVPQSLANKLNTHYGISLGPPVQLPEDPEPLSETFGKVFTSVLEDPLPDLQDESLSQSLKDLTSESQSPTINVLTDQSPPSIEQKDQSEIDYSNIHSDITTWPDQAVPYQPPLNSVGLHQQPTLSTAHHHNVPASYLNQHSYPINFTTRPAEVSSAFNPLPGTPAANYNLLQNPSSMMHNQPFDMTSSAAAYQYISSLQSSNPIISSTQLSSFYHPTANALHHQLSPAAHPILRDSHRPRPSPVPVSLGKDDRLFKLQMEKQE